MGFDRAAALRNAEKLLRLGKLDAAIAEYVRVVEDQPHDWNTTNALGDLYVRTGQIDLAVEQFLRIADSLAVEGFLPRASAVYKKILKLQPTHEHALLQSAEIAVSLGLLADARAQFGAVIARRQMRGDRQGVAEIHVRLGSIDPADLDARVAAANARVELDDPAGAARDLTTIAGELMEAGRTADAVDVLRRAASITPEDAEIRRRLAVVYATSGDLDRAEEYLSTAGEYVRLAAMFEARGDSDRALAARREAVRLDPDDHELRADLARALIARGEADAAAEYVSADMPGADPDMLLTAAGILVRTDRAEAGLSIIANVLRDSGEHRDRIVQLAGDVGEHSMDRGFKVVDLVVEVAVAAGDVAGAVTALDAWCARHAGHVPALMRLVELSVDGGLEEPMYRAQAGLADAYIAAGIAAQARFIAEDLVAHAPDEPLHVERLRRALELDGVADPDTIIAERRAGRSRPELQARASPAGGVVREEAAMVDDPFVVDEVAILEEAGSLFDVPVGIGDLESLLREIEPDPAQPDAPEQVEVDLSLDLDEILRPTAVAAPPVVPPIEGEDIDKVFEQMRGEASRRSSAEGAQQVYERALALRASGDIDGCIAGLQAAARDPRLRFAAASTLARLYRDRGELQRAIEWFERGVEAPAPTPDEGHALLYELAEALESDAEIARALAVCLELQSEAGTYRDITARIDRLTNLQGRG